MGQFKIKIRGKTTKTETLEDFIKFNAIYNNVVVAQVVWKKLYFQIAEACGKAMRPISKSLQNSLSKYSQILTTKTETLEDFTNSNAI